MPRCRVIPAGAIADDADWADANGGELVGKGDLRRAGIRAAIVADEFNMHVLVHRKLGILPLGRRLEIIAVHRLAELRHTQGACPAPTTRRCISLRVMTK